MLLREALSKFTLIILSGNGPFVARGMCGISELEGVVGHRG